MFMKVYFCRHCHFRRYNPCPHHNLPGCQFELEEERVQVPRTALRHEVAFALQVSGLPQRVDQTAVEGAGEVLQLQDDQQVPGGVVTGLGGQHEEDGGGRRL